VYEKEKPVNTTRNNQDRPSTASALLGEVCQKTGNVTCSVCHGNEHETA
jgi:cytochrome c5